MRDDDESRQEYKDQTEESDFELSCALEVFWKDQLNRIKERAEGQATR